MPLGNAQIQGCVSRDVCVAQLAMVADVAGQVLSRGCHYLVSASNKMGKQAHRELEDYLPVSPSF